MLFRSASGVDSCAIEGFSEPEVLTLSALDPADWTLSLVAAFGRRDEPRREKIREPLSSVVLRL